MKNIIKKQLKLNEIDNLELQKIIDNFERLKTKQEQYNFVINWLNNKSIKAIGEAIYIDNDIDNDKDIELIELKNRYLSQKRTIYNLPKNVEKENELFNLDIWYKREKERIISKKMKV